MTTSDWAGSLENTPAQEKREQELLDKIKRLDAALAEVRDMHLYRIRGDDVMEIIEIIDKARAGE
ncbi:MAG: hypothetical protein OEQ39_04130 [Gammaproteobacteria bacterium]|nr:hypothetical protein [Gammaproteobacteria bacterium]MDH3466200.1 hypothetical protein [Gammaproteobacteria bacterium]